MRSVKNHAVTEVIGVILVFTIVSSVVSATMFWAKDHLENEKMGSSVASAINQFDQIDDALSDMISQGVNSSRVVNFVTDAGYVHLGSSGTRFVIFYSLIQGTGNLGFDFNVSGFDDDNDYTFAIDLVKGEITSFNITWLNNGSIQNKEQRLSAPESDIVSANFSLVDAVKIDIKNYTECVGRIWLFDVGFLSYKTSTRYTATQVIVENGAVVSSRPYNHVLMDEPTIHYYKEFWCSHCVPGRWYYGMSMRIIQLKPDSETTVGPGPGSYRFIMRLNSIDIRDIQYRVHGCELKIRIQVFGDHADAWKQYFKFRYGFQNYDGKTLKTRPATLESFTLIHSICNIDLEII